MRPCVTCGYLSDPTTSPQCPECGAQQLPVEWSVLLRESSPWFWRMAHLGSLTFIALFAVWVLSFITDKKGPNIGAFTYLAVICFPISIAHLSGKRLDDIWIISDARLEHRPRVGNTTYHTAEEGWAPQPLKQQKRTGHLWVIELRKPSGKRPRKIELVIDDRQNDPKAIEALVSKVLAPQKG
jgi:hypothetical protein